MQTISNKQTCALSQFYDWLIRRNVRVMHVILADTTVADTIRYDTPSIGSDTIPIR